ATPPGPSDAVQECARRVRRGRSRRIAPAPAPPRTAMSAMPHFGAVRRAVRAGDSRRWRCSRSCSDGADMEPQATTIERDGRAALVRLHGALVVSRMREIYVVLRAVARQRDVAVMVLDFSDAGRIDSSGVAAIALIGRQLADSGKRLDLEHLGEQHRA